MVVVCVRTEYGEREKKKHGPGEEEVRGYKKTRGFTAHVMA